MRSPVERFKEPPPFDDAIYNTSCGGKKFIEDNVAGSPIKYSGVSTATARFGSYSEDKNFQFYDKDQNSIQRRIQDTPQRYSNLRSNKDRLTGMAGSINAAEYNTDTGPKACIATRLEASPMRYSSMNSSVPRLRESQPMHGGRDYNIDTAHKKSVYRASLEDSSIANVPFKSRLQRFSRPRLLEAQQRDYDSDVGVGQSIARQIEGTPRLYSNMRTGQHSSPNLECLDLEYNTDTLHKHTINSGIHDPSSRNYANIRSQTARFRSEPDPKISGCGNANALYETDTGHKMSIFHKVKASPIKYSSMGSPSRRFREYASQYKNADDFYNTDTGSKKSLAHSIADSPMRYSNIRSTIPRFSYHSTKKESAYQDFDYETLLKNKKIELRFVFENNQIIKKVGR